MAQDDDKAPERMPEADPERMPESTTDTAPAEDDAAVKLAAMQADMDKMRKQLAAKDNAVSEIAAQRAQLKKTLKDKFEEDEAKAREAAQSQGDFAEFKKLTEAKHAQELRDRDERFQTEQTITSRLLIDDAIRKAMLDANITRSTTVVFEFFKAKASMEDAPGSEYGRIGVIGGVPIAEFVASQAESDDFKAFVTVPTNAGGGTKASPTQPNGRVDASKQLYRDEMLPKEASAYVTAQGQDAYLALPASRPGAPAKH